LLHLYLVLYSRLSLRCSFVHSFLLCTTVFFTDDGSGTLKENLLDELDYVLVPSESWDLLVKWYGTVDQNTAIPRQVSLFVALHVIFIVYFLNPSNQYMGACTFAYVLVSYHQVICTESLSTQSRSYIISQRLANSCFLVGFCWLMSSLELLAKRYKAEVFAFLEGGTTSQGNSFLTFQQNVVSLILWCSITQCSVATSCKYSNLIYTPVKAKKLVK